MTPQPSQQPTPRPTGEPTFSPTQLPPDGKKNSFNSTNRTISIVLAVCLSAVAVMVVIFYNAYFSRDAKRARKQKRSGWQDRVAPDNDEEQIFTIDDVHAGDSNQAQNQSIEMYIRFTHALFPLAATPSPARARQPLTYVHWAGCSLCWALWVSPGRRR